MKVMYESKHYEGMFRTTVLTENSNPSLASFTRRSQQNGISIELNQS